MIAVGLLVVSCTQSGTGPNLPRPRSSSAGTITSTADAPTTTTEPTTANPDCLAAFCIVYHLSEGALWSDGRPVTAEDFATTAANMPESVYESVRSVEIIDPNNIKVLLNTPLGAWESMFLRVLPSVYAPGADMTTTPSNGAFRFTEWVPGDRIVVTRNESPWPGRVPISGQSWGDVSEIRFVFRPDPAEMIDALETGEVDVIVSRSTDVMTSITEVASANHVLSPGPFWEHLDFHHEDPLLAQMWVREAVALGIDREKILDRTVRLIDPTADSLDSSLWLANDFRYDDSYPFAYDPQRAVELLEEHFCEPARDGIYDCQGRRMSFFLAATSDDPDRVQAFESIQEDLEAIGIEVNPLFRTRSTFLSPDFLFAPSDVWQMINFSWRARSDPQVPRGTIECAGELNVNRYCNPDVDRLLHMAARSPDQETRTALLSEADEVYLADLGVIPLYQKRVLLAWSRTLFGPVPNVGPSTDLWNVGAWSGKQSITIALDAEPTHLDPTRTDDDNANVVLSTLLYGAFGMTPDFRFVPVLADAVGLIEGSPG
jgi:peptide/nickel transport system substrate-binding protein